jgi:Ribonucleotide reductase, barrel domain
MDSILTLAKTEGMLFKYGSGTGSNLSSLRASRELLAGGGTASGPVSFMKGFDASACVIKSGGKISPTAKRAEAYAMSTHLVTSKHVQNGPGWPKRKSSVRRLLGYIAGTLTRWGVEACSFAMSVKAVPLPKGENYAPWLDLVRDALSLVRITEFEPVRILVIFLFLVLALVGVLVLHRNREGLVATGKKAKTASKKSPSGSSQSSATGKRAKTAPKKSPSGNGRQPGATGKKAKTVPKKSPNGSSQSSATGKRAKTAPKKSPKGSGRQSGATGKNAKTAPKKSPSGSSQSGGPTGKKR